jgi:hypothetical protein
MRLKRGHRQLLNPCDATSLKPKAEWITKALKELRSVFVALVADDDVLDALARPHES